MSKSLEKIKHGDKVLAVMEEGESFFVHDLKGATGLDDSSLKRVLGALLKNGYISKNDRGLLHKSIAA